MACKRSAVRSRLAPPTFAGYASFGSASLSRGRFGARSAKHNAGEVSQTSKYKPWRLKTYVAFSDEKQAIAFEEHLKSGSGRAFANERL
jgi:hypothetical protein